MGRLPVWTEDDVNYLHLHLGKQSIKQIAKVLQRSVRSIQLMANRRGIDTSAGQGYSAHALEELLGWRHKRVKDLIDRGWLEASVRHMGYAEKRPDAYLITEKALYQCLIAHPELIDLRLVNAEWFLDLITRGAITQPRLGTPIKEKV